MVLNCISVIILVTYLFFSIILSLRYIKELCSNSKPTVGSCFWYVGRLCLRAGGMLMIGTTIVPIDYSCELAGVKPIFSFLYLPGLKRLAGDLTPELASQRSKDLIYINSNLPGASFIHKLQAKGDAVEAAFAEEYSHKLEKKYNR